MATRRYLNPPPIHDQTPDRARSDLRPALGRLHQVTPDRADLGLDRADLGLDRAGTDQADLDPANLDMDPAAMNQGDTHQGDRGDPDQGQANTDQEDPDPASLDPDRADLDLAPGVPNLVATDQNRAPQALGREPARLDPKRAQAHRMQAHRTQAGLPDQTTHQEDLMTHQEDLLTHQGGLMIEYLRTPSMATPVIQLAATPTSMRRPPSRMRAIEVIAAQ